MPKHFPAEFRQRALRLLGEARQQEQYETDWAAIQAVASRLGVNSETLRKWLRRSEIDAGTRPGVTTEELSTRIVSGSRGSVVCSVDSWNVGL